jgi:hypothetical protein
MSSQQKRGFRLPWAPDRESGESAGAAALEDEPETAARLDLLQGAAGDGLGEGPFHFTDEPTPDPSTDASPEAPDVPETTGEAAMIDTESGTTETAEAAPPTNDPDAWPSADQREAPAAATEVAPEPAVPTTSPRPIRVEGDLRAPRSNPLVAGLVKAMREAAIASREETTTRLHADATARVEAIREAATAQTAELRKRADDDVAEIREWSKAEIARVKQETDERIEGRRSELIAQTEHHGAEVERHVEQVQSTVSAFETDMDRFFEQLLSETDPARLASLAERAPEPPDLTGDIATPISEWEGVAWTNPGLEADAAAEAEASATEGLDLPSDDNWPASVLAVRGDDTSAGADAPEGAGTSRLFVNGLTSVAGISAFKGAVGQLPGVRSVSVSSGEPGVFIFTVAHEPEADLQAAVAGLTQFSTRVTDASGDSLTVSANEPAA